MPRILVCGDSIAWGQGLEDHQKYSALVETILRNHWTEIEIERQTLAHSGAIIGIGRSQAEPAIDQEVPVDDPTIFQQVTQFRERPGEAAEVALVLLSGGINDVNIRTILSPLTSENDLRIKTRKYCYDDMLALLTECVQVFPNARIIVTGYYPMISMLSNIVLVSSFVGVFGLILSFIPGTVTLTGIATTATLGAIVANCNVFASTANASLQRAVDEINEGLGPQANGPRIALAVPDFKPQNAALAPDSYLYGVRLTGDPTEPIAPTDQNPVLGSRIAACHAAKDSGRIPDYWVCKLASTGHPNAKGAQAYGNAISPIIERWLLAGWRPWQNLSLSSWLSLLLGS